MIEYESDIVPFFSKAIYSKVTNIATEEIVPLLDSFDYRKSGMQDITDLNDTNNLSLSSISNKVLDDNKFKFLKDILMKEFYLYASDVMGYTNEFEITTSWFTRATKGQSSNFHNHSNCIGEASGDLHGANLMKALYQQDTDATIHYWGGDLMQQVGGTLVKKRFINIFSKRNSS